MNLATNIRVLLKRNGRNQGDLAEITGKSRSTAGAYVRGDAMPPADILVQIANYFGVSLDQLVLSDLQNERTYAQPPVSVQYASEPEVVYETSIHREVENLKMELKMLQKQVITLEKLATTQSDLIEHLRTTEDHKK